jgi:hypothetical protein
MKGYNSEAVSAPGGYAIAKSAAAGMVPPRVDVEFHPS